MNLVMITEYYHNKERWFKLFVETDNPVELLKEVRRKYDRKGILIAKPIERKDVWLVAAGFDVGDGESGPMVHSDQTVVYAKSEEEAIEKSGFLGVYSYIGGCAEPASDQDIKEFNEWVDMEAHFDDYNEFEYEYVI